MSAEPQLWTNIDLNVKNCDESVNVLMKKLVKNLTNRQVRKVCVQNAANFSDKGLEILAQNCPNLRHLQVKNCKNLTNHGVQNALQKCNALSHLELPGKTF